MELTLKRTDLHDDTTIGELTIDGVRECFTLEDVVRPAGATKVYGNTAIPAGRYRVEVTYSPRFKQQMPLLHDVPGFSGVRIHPGNTHKDTEGCILVGQTRDGRSIGQSRAAYAALLAKINAAAGPVWLTIG